MFSSLVTASGLQTLPCIREASSHEKQAGNALRLYLADPEILGFASFQETSMKKGDATDYN